MKILKESNKQAKVFIGWEVTHSSKLNVMNLRIFIHIVLMEMQANSNVKLCKLF